MDNFRNQLTTVFLQKTLISIAGGIAVLLGLIVIAGWITHKESLIQVLPGYTPMQFNTAVSFLLCGIGLLAQLYNKPRISILAGIAVILIGALTIVEYATDVDLFIDQFFIDHYISTNTMHPGRMAPSTAIAFILSGAALLCFRCALLFSKIHNMIPGILGALVTSIGLGTLFGYMLGMNTPYGWLHPTHMAIHTTIGVTVLGAGIALLSYYEQSKSNNQSQKWLAPATSIGVAMLAIVLWQILLTQERQHINKTVSVKISSLQSKIQDAVEHQVGSLIRLGNRWEIHGGTPRNEWEADAVKYIDHLPSYQAIEWVDSSFHVRWIVPLDENKQAQDLDQTYAARRRDAMILALEERRAYLTRPITLVQGGKGFLIYKPLFTKNRFDGFMVGVFRIDKLLDPVMQHEQLSQDFHISVFENDDLIYENLESSSPATKEWEQEEVIKLRNVTWQLIASPTQKMLSSTQSLVPEAALGTGLLIAFLLALTINRVQSARLHAKAFERTNKNLKSELVTRKKIENSLKEYKEHLEELVDERTAVLQETNIRLSREINDRESTEKVLREREKQLRELTRHLETIREEERTLIAREIHDELGQLLTALSMDVHWIISHCPENSHTLEEKALSMVPNIEIAIKTVQRIVSNLRPAILDDLGLVAAINWYCEQCQTRNGITCKLNVSLDDISIDPASSTAIFRILQESLTNIARHSHATNVEITTGIKGHNIYMRITDNGIGVSDTDLAASNAFGLIGMRERAIALGGSLVIERNNGPGTTVNLLLPIYCDINAPNITPEIYEGNLS